MNARMKHVLKRMGRGLFYMTVATLIIASAVAVILVLVWPIFAVDRYGTYWPLLAYIPALLVAAYFMGDV